MLRPTLVFTDQITRFVFGLSGILIVMILVQGEKQTLLLFTLSTVSFASLIVRWGADHTYFVKIIGMPSHKSRTLAINAVAVTAVITSIVALGLFLYYLLIPGLHSLGVWNISIFSLCVINQVSAPLEVLCRKSEAFSDTVYVRISAQLILLILKVVALTQYGVMSFAIVNLIESVFVAGLYIVFCNIRKRDWLLLRWTKLREQALIGAMWGLVAIATMVLSVYLMSVCMQLLPPDSASLFIFGYRLFGAANNVISAGAIAISKKLMHVGKIDAFLLMCLIISALVSFASFGLLFGYVRLFELERGSFPTTYLALGGFISALPLAAASVLTGRLLIVNFGPHISLVRVLAAIIILHYCNSFLLLGGLFGAIILVALIYATMIGCGLLLFYILRYKQR